MTTAPENLWKVLKDPISIAEKMYLLGYGLFNRDKVQRKINTEKSAAFVASFHLIYTHEAYLKLVEAGAIDGDKVWDLAAQGYDDGVHSPSKANRIGLKDVAILECLAGGWVPLGESDQATTMAPIPAAAPSV